MLGGVGRLAGSEDGGGCGGATSATVSASYTSVETEVRVLSAEQNLTLNRNNKDNLSN